MRFFCSLNDHINDRILSQAHDQHRISRYSRFSLASQVAFTVGARSNTDLYWQNLGPNDITGISKRLGEPDGAACIYLCVQ